ncbi:MAG TPA: Bax inhibitor-1/YccA family protein [Acidimicrobiia bacterium]|jgi:uncharacterized YccA/Bax inhibitor family protein
MASPVLSEKAFERVRDESEPGWAAPDTLTAGEAPAAPTRAGRTMTANGTFARAFVLFLLVLAGGAFGWQQVDVTSATQVNIPDWSWLVLIGAFGAAMVCAFVPKVSPFLGPVYALLEGVFLGILSKAFEVRWDGIVLQAILATVAVFLVTLALYVFGVVKVTNRFIMIVLGATIGIFLMYAVTWIATLLGADLTFWNDPTPLGIIITAGIAVVAALNLFLDYEFIRRASIAGAPSYMEWYGAFGLMVTLVWLYLEVLRLLSLLRQ